MLYAVLSLLSCAELATTPANITDCSDRDCRARWIVQHWAERPEAVHDAVGALPDPIERVAVVIQLTEAHPGQTRALCPVLPPGPDRGRCVQLNSRPHLFTARRAPQADAVRLSRGPAGPSRLPPRPWPSALVSVPASQTVCAVPSVSACQSHEAAEAILSGDAAEAAAHCQAIPEPLWREECLFMTAQKLVALHNAASYRSAVDLCALSGDFIGDCLAHLSNTLRPGGETHDWSTAAQAADTIAATWAEHDPGFGAILVDHFWAAAVWRRYGQQGVVLGAPQETPTAMLPHVRTVSAINLLRLEAPEQHQSLTALTEALVTVMLQPRPHTRRLETLRSTVAFTGDRWLEDADESEAMIPALVLPGGARRPTDRDPQVDAVLAILEAAAYHQPPRLDLLAQGRADPRAVVRWSATRLETHPENTTP